MFAYLSIQADMRSENDGGVGERARATESVRQGAEADAWAAVQSKKKGVTVDG